MAIATELPLLEGLSEFEPASAAADQRLPRVTLKTRRGPLLHANPLSDDPSVLSLNLAQGCMHRCTFCSIRGHSAYRGNEEVLLYASTARLLEVELAKKSILPRAVVISPSCDPFAPNLLIQEETLNVVRVLAKFGVESWLMTRGYIRPKVLEGLLPYRDKVRLRVATTTADRKLQRIIEPLTAPPVLRMRQLRALRAAGFRVDVAIEPLVPGVTDTRENLLPLRKTLAEAGIETVSVGYAFMRAGIRANLEQAVEALGMDIEDIDEDYEKGPILTSGLIAAARYMPRIRRERSYAALMAWGEELGIRVSVCRTTNPDFRSTIPAGTGAKPKVSLLSLLASANHSG
jgi:DNA repair photolyase